MTRATIPLGLAAVILAGPATAQGWIEPTPGIPMGQAIVKLRTSVAVEVHDRIATIVVEEWFENRGGGLGEGDYIYPLPGEAVFANFSLFQGDEELRGETMDAEQARGIYEEIVRRKRDPALIELVGHGMVRARVFPINAGERRRITLRYTQVLPKAGDALQFRYAAGGRTAANAMGRPAPDQAPIDFVMTIDDGAGFADPFSPTHRLQVRRDDDAIRVRSADALRGNLAVFLPLASDVAGLTMAAHRATTTEDGFFMLTVSPGAADGDPLPRDVTVVFDVSGSMSGTKMTQAKSALRQLLGTLNANDRFRLVAFNNRVTSHSGDWTAATSPHLAVAREWVDARVADGGTNIDGALTEAFRLDSPDDRLGIVLFLTDGIPSVGEGDPDRIAARAAGGRGRARVFAFGVGYDVNTYLLDQLSREGRGSTEYVEPNEDVEQALSTLARKIGHPVLTDLRLSAPGLTLDEVYPRDLPDLFAGEELLLFGRYRDGTASTRITVTGRRGGGEVSLRSEVELPTHRTANDFIPRLWASRKLGSLTQTLRLEGGTPELIEEIRHTALEFGLLSEFTSYLVQEPEAVANRPTLPILEPDTRRNLDETLGRVRGLPSTPPPSRDAVTTRSSGAGSVTGQRAVERSEESRQRRQVQTAAELDEMEAHFADSRDDAGTTRVAGRVFELRQQVWTDRGHVDSLPVTDIKPFSDAYFRLLRLAPELEQWLSAFDQVLVAGARANIRVSNAGRESLPGAELARLVGEFRGR